MEILINHHQMILRLGYLLHLFINEVSILLKFLKNVLNTFQNVI